MAVTLPTITVTDAQGAAILAAYKARFGTTTQAETAEAFKDWLTESVRDVVMTHEARKLDEAANVAKRDALDVVRSKLPTAKVDAATTV